MSGPTTEPIKDPSLTIDKDDARQGSEESTLRYILSISMSLAAIALLAVAYVYV